MAITLWLVISKDLEQSSSWCLSDFVHQLTSTRRKKSELREGDIWCLDRCLLL